MGNNPLSDAAPSLTPSLNSEMQVYFYGSDETAQYASLFHEEDHPRDVIGEFMKKDGKGELISLESLRSKKPSKKPAAAELPPLVIEADHLVTAVQ